MLLFVWALWVCVRVCVCVCVGGVGVCVNHFTTYISPPYKITVSKSQCKGNKNENLFDPFPLDVIRSLNI